MTGKYKAYPEYKDSGVEWLGAVPEHWVIGRYKFCTNRIVVGIAEAATQSYADIGVPIIRSTNIKEGYIDISSLLYIKEEFAEQNNSKYLYTNDVITVRTGYPGVSSVIPESLNKSQCFTNLIATPSNRNVSKFLTYYLNSHTGKSYFELLSWGSAQKNISVPILQNIPIAFPSKDEQEIIANFLDQETAKIDTLIEKQQTLIKLLKEKRQAVISHAVTKGLNPDAPMRDSGVEWLGEVPEHWVVCCIKNIISPIKDSIVDGPFGSSVNTERDYVDVGIPVIRTINITNSGFSNNNLKFMREEKFNELKRHAVYPGDVLFSKVGTIGNACILPDEVPEAILSTTGSCKITVDSNKYISKFLVLVIQSMYENLMLIANANVQPFLNMGNIKNLKMPMPCLKEQSQILEILDNKLTSIDNIILKAISSEKLLEERRTALISAAVTGKIDVRNWKASRNHPKPAWEILHEHHPGNG